MTEKASTGRSDPAGGPRTDSIDRHDLDALKAGTVVADRSYGFWTKVDHQGLWYNPVHKDRLWSAEDLLGAACGPVVVVGAPEPLETGSGFVCAWLPAVSGNRAMLRVEQDSSCSESFRRQFQGSSDIWWGVTTRVG